MRDDAVRNATFAPLQDQRRFPQCPEARRFASDRAIRICALGSNKYCARLFVIPPA